MTSPTAARGSGSSGGGATAAFNPPSTITEEPAPAGGAGDAPSAALSAPPPDAAPSQSAAPPEEPAPAPAESTPPATVDTTAPLPDAGPADAPAPQPTADSEPAPSDASPPATAPAPASPVAESDGAAPAPAPVDSAAPVDEADDFAEDDTLAQVMTGRRSSLIPLDGEAAAAAAVAAVANDDGQAPVTQPLESSGAGEGVDAVPAAEGAVTEPAAVAAPIVPPSPSAASAPVHTSHDVGLATNGAGSGAPLPAPPADTSVNVPISPSPSALPGGSGAPTPQQPAATLSRPASTRSIDAGLPKPAPAPASRASLRIPSTRSMTGGGGSGTASAATTPLGAGAPARVPATPPQAPPASQGLTQGASSVPATPKSVASRLSLTWAAATPTAAAAARRPSTSSVRSASHSHARPTTASVASTPRRGTGDGGSVSGSVTAAAVAPATPVSATRGRGGAIVRPPSVARSSSRTTGPVSAVPSRSTSNTRQLAANMVGLTPAPAAAAAVGGGSSRTATGPHAHVSSRFREAAAAATVKARSQRGASQSRSTSVPPPARYTPGVGHSRGWVDITNRVDVEAATEADAVATAQSLGLMAPAADTTAADLTEPGGAPAAAGDLSATGGSLRRANPATVPAALLSAALDITAPIALSPSRAPSRGRSALPLFGAGTASRHPLRRSSRAAEIEDSVEIARAQTLGLVVGSRARITQTPDQVHATVHRLYDNAAEVRAKKAMAATAALSEHTFSPMITAKAAAMGSRITYATGNLDASTLPRGRSASVGAGGGAAAVPRYLVLHSNAAGLAAKRAQELERVTREDENCTFRPWITAKAHALVATRGSGGGDDGASDAGASTVSERLYSMARTYEEKKAAAAEVLTRQEAPFHPALNPSSLAMAAAYERRAPLHEVSEDVRPAALEERRRKLELASCTFSPAINATTRAVAAVDAHGNPLPAFERLLERGREAGEKQATLRRHLADEELSKATFHPAIDARSQRLMERKGRSASRGSTATRTTNGTGGAAPPTPVLDPVVAEATASRLYADAETIRSRLEEKRRQLEAAKAAACTYKPAIDKNSRIMMLARRMGNETGVGDGGGGDISLVPSMGHPQKVIFGSPDGGGSVWERLYADAKDFEEARGRAIAAAVEAEVAAVTFQPVISEKSRRIAAIADSVLTSLATMRPGGEGGGVDEAGSSASARKAAVWDRLYAQALSEPEIRALRAEMARRIELRDCTFKPRTLFSPPPPPAADAAAAGAGAAATATANGGGGGSPSAPRRDVWAELSSQQKDVSKLDEIKARLELAQCTFAPNVLPHSDSRISASGAAAHGKSFRHTGGGAAAGPEVPGRAADAWDRIVAEVEREAAEGGVKAKTSHDIERSMTRGRSASPAVFER